MATRQKVLVTGASGLIGGLVIKNLGEKYEFTALNRRPLEDIASTQADISNFESIQMAFTNIDTVFHLGALATPGLTNNWDGIVSTNIHGTFNVYEASRIAGVKRIIFASSGGTIQGYEKDPEYKNLVAGDYENLPKNWPMIDHTSPLRPGSLYGVSKIFGEALGRYYSDVHGISILNLRLGAVIDTDRPKVPRQYPVYLSHSDCLQLIDLCLSAPDSFRYEIFEAVSDNKFRWRDNSYTKDVLGWKPTADSYKYLFKR